MRGRGCHDHHALLRVSCRRLAVGGSRGRICDKMMVDGSSRPSSLVSRLSDLASSHTHTNADVLAASPYPLSPSPALPVLLAGTGFKTTYSPAARQATRLR